MEKEITLEEIIETLTRRIAGARKYWTAEFDGKNTLNDWSAYAGSFFGRAISIESTPDKQIDNLYKAAVVTLSALYHAENKMLAPRHYEDRVGKPRASGQ